MVSIGGQSFHFHIQLLSAFSRKRLPGHTGTTLLSFSHDVNFILWQCFGSLGIMSALPQEERWWQITQACSTELTNPYVTSRSEGSRYLRRISIKLEAYISWDPLPAAFFKDELKAADWHAGARIMLFTLLSPPCYFIGPNHQQPSLLHSCPKWPPSPTPPPLVVDSEKIFNESSSFSLSVG